MNYHYVGAMEIASMLASKTISSVELIDSAIARITKHDGKINAVVVRDFERARRDAARADAELHQGKFQPLLGVPITVKESFNVGELATNWGVTSFRDWRPRSESLGVQRLKRAGAIILGKTNISEGLSDWQCRNEIFGQTNNPWNLARTPGGSSGGSAAALAAGFSFLELGSDVAGSIRIPAHFCGVYGHRPTYGLLSSQGYAFPSTFAASDLSTIGPLSRTAADLHLAFELLVGPSQQESIAYSVKVPRARHDSLDKYRVLVLQEHPLVPTAREVRAPVLQIIEELRKRGATVGTRSPLLPDLAEATRVCLRLLVPLTLSRVSDQHYEKLVEQIKQMPKDDNNLASVGLRAGIGSHRDWIWANESRSRLFLQWQKLFRDWDVVVCPAAPTVAFPHDSRPLHMRTLDIDGLSIPYFDQIAWSSLATGSGLPATTVPFGLTSNHLPVGLQIIGPYLEDRSTLMFAQLLEREFGGFSPPAESVQ